jgi:hypothetical protein
MRIQRFTIIALFIFSFAIQLQAQEFCGKTSYWTIDDFLGFDEVGDAAGSTGDISSAFARLNKEELQLRITFDDMVLRSENKVVKDCFLNQDIDVEITVADGLSKRLLGNRFNISKLDGSKSNFNFLRTPQHNMLEMAFYDQGLLGKNRKDLQFILKVFINGKLADEFEVGGQGSKATGNCAFVHHGNQGLTYTEVFYGSANGISGLDGSGFDEVLQAHEATDVPGNFHMSGTLMPAAEWHNPEFNDWLESLAAEGLVSMMTSALGQHIMPFVHNEMNDWSVHVESQMVDFQYNYTPRIAWVPERVWLGQGYYPDAGVIDWLGDNWTQHGVWGVVLDDGPHLNGYDNRKIHWMNNGLGVDLRVIPINNTFVGQMHYDANGAKNTIASMGQYNICVYGTDWEVAAEMNEHDGSGFLDNYEDVLWYCHDNYPGVNVWKLEDAIQNPDFNGTTASLTKGTYGLLGGSDGYGGSNNSWYTNWASTPSHSDQHSPQWDYGTVWSDAYNTLIAVNDNNLAQLSWYTLMINLHETGWHTSGDVADWEHRYSSHIKNANVYTEASRWADGQYVVTTACYFEDIDHDGVDELVMHNDKVFMVFEEIGGKANWVFYKDGIGGAYSVVSSDIAYWSETDGDYNESGSKNHVAALSDVWPNQQNSIYNITINKSFGDTVEAVLDQWGVEKTFALVTGENYLDVIYNFYDQTGYVKSGWTPDLLDIIWSGKGHLQRVWGDYGSYCGYRNSANGATAALVLGNGGASHNGEFEGTLVKGDEVFGYSQFKMRMYAGYTSDPTGTSVAELDALALENMDVIPPVLYSPAAIVANNKLLLSFSEAVDISIAQNIANYSLENFTGSYSIISAIRQTDWSKVELTISGVFTPGDEGQVTVINIEDLSGNAITTQLSADLSIPAGFTPHTILIDGINDFLNESELMEIQGHNLWITWDNDNLFIGFFDMDLNNDGDLFVNIDTDQIPGSGATTGSWGRSQFADPYLPDFQVAIEGGGGSMQVNSWTGLSWNYPGNGTIGNSYEGWSGNGMTEISIPWTDLGNPVGIAISVHISDEDTQLVPEIFPSTNATGFQPIITHFYGFFEPFVLGSMPLSGMEPNKVIVVPNSPAEIQDYMPLNSDVVMLYDDQESFAISAFDDDDDEIVYTWVLDGNIVSSTNAFIYEPVLSDVGNHILHAIVSDEIPGNDPDSVSWQISVIEDELLLDLRIFLEGPYNGSVMETRLNSEDFIPLVQPYHQAPWNYGGDESVISIPGINVVDWVLIELRDAPDAASAGSGTILAQQAAFVKNDGQVINIAGSNQLRFDNSFSQSLFVVIWHRDHLGVMSANPLTETGGVYAYDFSTALDRVHEGALGGYKELAPGTYGMVAGDANADGLVNDMDKDDHWELEVGNDGYLNSDFGLDSQVDNADKNDIWLPNTGDGSQVEGTYNAYKCNVPD